MLGYGPYGMMGYGNGWGSMGWMMLIGGAFWVLLLVLGAAVVIWVLRGPNSGGVHPPRTQGLSPGLDILEERYARGEINRDEYLQKRGDILGRSTAK